MTEFPDVFPQSRVPDARSAPTLSWGVMGTGWIAERFVGSVQRNTSQHFTAVGSRSAAGAQAFGDKHGIPHRHGSFDALLADPDVDVVYVATPHPHHHDGALAALRAGKHVLVEKPLALDAHQAAEIHALATELGLFVMEAMWTFFLPKFDVIRQVIDAGWLGRITTLIADHGEHFAPEHRIMRADLAGGPLFDLGTYPVALATTLFGEATLVSAVGPMGPAGVNQQITAWLQHSAGQQTSLNTTLLATTPTTAAIAGDRGMLSIDGPFFAPGRLTLTSADRSRQIVRDEPAIAHEGLFYEAAEVARCIDAGLTESPLHPMAETIATLRTLDEIRAQIGQTLP